MNRHVIVEQNPQKERRFLLRVAIVHMVSLAGFFALGYLARPVIDAWIWRVQ